MTPLAAADVRDVDPGMPPPELRTVSGELRAPPARRAACRAWAVEIADRPQAGGR